MTADVTPIREALDNPQAVPPLAQPGEAVERAKRERPPFPPVCPVVPLGIKASLDGKQTCYYLDVNKQLVGMEANNKHGKLGLIALFGGQSDWLEENFPQWSAPKYEGRGAARRLVQPSEIVGFDQAEAARALVEECCRKGIFTAAGKMRGNGAHRHGAGGLVLHCGDTLLVSEHRADGTIKGWRYIDPGQVGSFVYPGGEKIPRPWHEPVGPEIVRLLIGGEIGRGGLPGLLGTWNWRRPLIDPRLLLGAIGAAMLGGALGWRSNVWVTGGRGTGKSSLNGQDGVLHQLLGDGLFRTGNASAAAVRQSLANATVPVLFDEIEASADNRRVTEVVELARVASSGDKMHRGGQDHSAHEFTLRSLFFFSSINIPPLQPQDRSRLAILELQPFPPEAVPPELARYNLPVLGRKLLRRMVDGWHRLEATKLMYHEALAGAGHDGRACDQFGTLLACAEILLHDHAETGGLPDIEDVDEWAQRCRPDRMREISQEEPDYVRCLNHLVSSQVQAKGGDERVELATWIGGAVDHAMAPLLAGADARAGDEKANERLGNLGLKVVNARALELERDLAGTVTGARWGVDAFNAGLPGYLAIATDPNHQGLAKQFEGQVWQKIWGDALARFPDALECRKVRFGHRTLKAVLVPLWRVLDGEALPSASRPDEAAAWLQDVLEGGEG